GSFTFLFFMIMCIASFLFIWKWVPETKGKSLEEIEHIWK
ncbi:MFS transporter, partial [Priestia megaterium]